MPRKKRNTFKYTVVDKKTYQTDTCGILFKLKINGVEADGCWSKTYSYTHDGVDLNEIDLNGKRIKIFNGGGSYRTYEIFGVPEKLLKQPKDLRFTGPYYETKNLGPVLVNKIKEGLKNSLDAKLTQEFLDAFDLKIDDLQHNRDEKLKQLLG